MEDRLLIPSEVLQIAHVILTEIGEIAEKHQSGAAMATALVTCLVCGAHAGGCTLDQLIEDITGAWKAAEQDVA